MEELECRYDTRQSFYGKAKIKDYYVNKNIHILELYSYGTLVAEIKEYKKETIYIYYGQYSHTTTRHQKEFFKQNGLRDFQIKELFKKGNLIKEEI